ncbi:EAL domain-containing protein [Nitrosophilus labii]|uniref:EAL domain-containing protein n=1 Tax=Nitrosophilus labii TaxID=2706014 RepID=UPI00165703CF|nr:EAL domain-containing protein [Nitrosophilus labii]
MFNISLSNKILIYFFLITVSIIISTYLVLEKITKQAFYDAELEKAKIIAKTVTPLLALDLFLGLDDNINKILKELSKNENILSVSIIKGNEIYKEFKKKISNDEDSFLVSRRIVQPNSNKILGRLEILYSSKHYKNLVKKYQKALFIFLAVLWILILLFGYYLNILIKPLRNIAKDLENYDPKNSIRFKYVEKSDEIGAISKALNKMQGKIKDYSKRLESMNKILEKKVEIKTKELKEQLYLDSLTKLPNRFSLVKDIQSAKKSSLIIINIDDFKQINDFFGHETGDKILKGFANRLRNLLKTEFPKIYRLSGDEFALFFNKKMTKGDLEYFIEILMKNIENMTFIHNDNELNIRVTIGAAIETNSPLEKADIALKLARKERVPYKIYDKDLKIEKQYKENIEWVKKIKKAIDKNRIVPYFQPIFSTSEFKLKGYECLMRLVEENGECITPTNFLEIAKKSRYYTYLTKIMFEKSCSYFSNLDCTFSFNLSIEDISNPEIIEFIKETIDRYKVYEKTIFEIVESEGIENFEEVSVFIENMKQLGAKIAIDDFGSGYSNFEYLAKLTIDYIKIDGSLIKNIDKDEDSRIVVEIIVDYAKKKGIKTVAEFVGNEKIYKTVKKIGVDFAQGYYIGKPGPTTIFDINK